MTRNFYRIVKSDPPTLTDFLSDRARGRPPAEEPARLRLHDGLSVYATLAQARRKAKAFPMLGRYLAVLRILDGTPLRYERTIASSGGHHTIWGEPEALLECVEAVVAV